MNPKTWTLRQQIERGIAAAALLLVLIWPAAGFSSYWSHTILLETFIFGIAAASLIFLSAYGGMVSLAQTALFGIAGIIFGNMATKGGPGGTSKGLHLGWDPTVALILALVLTTVIGLIGGAVASRSAGIYFLMITLTYSVIATYMLSQVTNISGFSGIGGINNYTPGWIGNLLDHPNRLYYIALGVAIVVYVRHPLPRADAVRALAPGRPRRADPRGLARLQRPAAPDARVRLRRVPRRPRRACSTPGSRGRSRPATSTCRRRSTC